MRKDESYKLVLSDPETYQATMKQLTDIIVYDIFSPPVASRVYVYPNIAAYEILAVANPSEYKSLAGQLNELTAIPKPENKKINFELASLHAFMKVGRTLIFSEQKMEAYQAKLYSQLESKGLPSSVKEASFAYGDKVAGHILAWADGDMYKQTRTFPKYTIQPETRAWKPTPPAYMDGIEPHWREIRTMILDSAEQFPPIPPLEFNMKSESEFYKQLIEVYDVGNGLDEEQKEIAKFWDCNPYVAHQRGHAMFATKKITPGGHWMGIAAIASRQAKADFAQTVNAFTLTSIALFDGFISCWDEKWRSILVRPETLINDHIDAEWAPLLQTPPFPEYTSGHSVISRAAAVTLTSVYGEQFSFLDTTEIEYGLTKRNFNSFLEASEEAAISRLYGGIHYMMAIENGIEQGENVGDWVVANINTKVTKNVAQK